MSPPFPLPSSSIGAVNPTTNSPLRYKSSRTHARAGAPPPTPRLAPSLCLPLQRRWGPPPLPATGRHHRRRQPRRRATLSSWFVCPALASFRFSRLARWFLLPCTLDPAPSLLPRRAVLLAPRGCGPALLAAEFDRIAANGNGISPSRHLYPAIFRPFSRLCSCLFRGCLRTAEQGTFSPRR
jgi:hypothetical protein